MNGERKKRKGEKKAERKEGENSKKSG